MGRTTLLVESVGAFAVALVIVFVLVLWSMLRSYRLMPPRVRGLSQGEEPRYLVLLTEAARRRLEEVGFRAAGFLATKPMIATEPEVVQLVMRNDEGCTVAYLDARHPFNGARPSVVAFESFLPDGSVLGTTGRFASTIGPPLANRRRSDADDDRGIYRDHVAGLAQAGLAATVLPGTFEELVALNIADAAWIWRTRVEQGVVVVSERDGEFRYARWASLAAIPRLLSEQLWRAILEARRRKSDRTLGVVVDARAPEIRQFIDDLARRKKEAADATAEHFKLSRGRTATLWMALVIGFTVFWQFLSHRPR